MYEEIAVTQDECEMGLHSDGPIMFIDSVAQDLYTWKPPDILLRYINRPGLIRRSVIYFLNWRDPQVHAQALEERVMITTREKPVVRIYKLPNGLTAYAAVVERRAMPDDK